MNKLGSTTLLCAALVLWCGAVQAETASRSPSDRSSSQTKAQVSQAQATLQAATAQVSWMSLRSDRVFRWLRVARGQGDARRSRCLDGKLSETHAVERQGRAELQAIRRATKLGDAAYGHHLARLRRFADRSNQLMAAAHRCGQKVSRRQRLPTTYRVRMVEPKLPSATLPSATLPSATQQVRRSSHRQRPHRTARAAR